jgi:hypothetical protein
MTTSQKQCVPGALAGASGTSLCSEGADRPTPHAETIPVSRHAGKRVLVFKWRDGRLQHTTTANASLTLLQLAVLAGRVHHPPA